MTRLLILGLLAERGEMHGHQIRREAELVNIEAWGDVKVGALYGALHRMEAEGLIRVVRSEQAGRFPARTVYAITDDGHTEFTLLRDRALQEARISPDPFDVALAVADLPLDHLTRLTEQRRRALAARLDELVSERERLEAAGLLPAAHRAIFHHCELRVQAELAFHEELGTRLPDIVSQMHAARAHDATDEQRPVAVVTLRANRRTGQRRARPAANREGGPRG